MRAVVIFVLCCLPLAHANGLEITGRFEQGGLAVGTAPVGSIVTFNGKPLATTYVGRFVMGFDRDAPGTADIEIKLPDGQIEKRTLTIQPRTWEIERINGLPGRLVTPNAKTQAKIEADNKLMAAARARTESVPFFETGFLMPAEGRKSGVFGSQRILNGKPRAPHLGLDIAAPIGTPVKATADGIVSLAKADMVLTGKSVVIEHGFGLDSIYIHMNDIRVKDGDRVRQGDVIGEIGKTGRTSGPHLHFGITWFDTRLDPEVVMAVMPPRTPPVAN